MLLYYQLRYLFFGVVCIIGVCEYVYIIIYAFFVVSIIFRLNKRKEISNFICVVAVVLINLINLLIYLSDYNDVISHELVSVIVDISICFAIISIIFNIKKHKKISNIIFTISIILLCVINLFYITSKNYNSQFSQYNTISNESSMSELINATIEHNSKFEKKITLIYQNTNYTSVEELEQLLNNIDMDIGKFEEYKCSKYYNCIGYINTIELKIHNIFDEPVY